MCGITGIYAFNDEGRKFINLIGKSVNTLKQRGPDSSGIHKNNKIGLGHSRLAVIDTSDLASQPFSDISSRYTIVYNGEFYNFKEQRRILEQKGNRFRSESDTEVLLYMFIAYGSSFIEKVNGCFALAIYDSYEDTLIILRDRIGIKPLLYYFDRDKFIFASEMKALLEFNMPKIIDNVSLREYLQFNYIPEPFSIFESVRKLEPGNGLLIKDNKIQKYQYYNISFSAQRCETNYEEARTKLAGLIEESVKRRLISDVPLGTFLSGGIDSSIVTALASRYTEKLNTFSIGFSDEPYFDETYFARLVAKKYNTRHHVFYLSNRDLFNNLFDILDYIDEPFADSSAIAVNILSKYTKQHVTVALSGDGADELFAGYNKHKAHLLASSWRYKKIFSIAMKLFKYLPRSRNGKISNFFRQMNRFAAGIELEPEERYWLWCLANNEQYADKIYNGKFSWGEYSNRKEQLCKFHSDSEINSILLNDMTLILPGDMLHKVDLMSMSNGIEVRTPFLDHKVVDYVFSLPAEFKIDRHFQKKILKDSFRDLLPEEILQRNKHGFEVPLLKWFRNELFSLINDDLLEENFIREQNIFNFTAVKELKNKINFNINDDITSKIWGLVVFQYWWKKYYL